MIEINLIPDVKQELIKAQRVRAGVISMAVIVAIAAVGVVVVLALWVFAVQAARGVISDNTIKTEHDKLSKVQDVSNTLTIQNQLSKVGAMHDSKNIDSRVFDVLATINPPAPNNVSITKMVLSSTDKTIRVEAQALAGYPALEVFKKTISATNFIYKNSDGEDKTVALASGISDSDRSYGQDASGAKVLRFTLTFSYSEDLFSRLSQNGVIVAPTQKNVTDSFVGVPQSLFTQKASDVQEGN